MTRILKALLRWVLILGFSGLLLIALAAGVAYWLVAPRLPSVAVLKDYHMQVPLQVSIRQIISDRFSSSPWRRCCYFRCFIYLPEGQGILATSRD